MKKRYRIAENTMEISFDSENDLWPLLERCYEPFRIDETDSSASSVRIQIIDGLEEMPTSISLLYEDEPDTPEEGR